jgi:chorismate-pyruvate lyase
MEQTTKVFADVRGQARIPHVQALLNATKDDGRLIVRTSRATQNASSLLVTCSESRYMREIGLQVE